MLVFKNFLSWVKSFLGFPEPPTEEQKTERMITMRCRGGRDCHVAAVATACGVTYEQAHKALWHFNLPWFLESPILSNPLNVKRGVSALGFTPVEISLSPLINNMATPGKVIVLVHDPKNPIFAQHWVVWFGLGMDGKHRLHWGENQNFELKTQQELIDLVTAGTPNCVFEVRKD